MTVNNALQQFLPIENAMLELYKLIHVARCENNFPRGSKDSEVARDTRRGGKSKFIEAAKMSLFL